MPREVLHADVPQPHMHGWPHPSQEAIDLTCKPEFTEVNDGTTALRMLLLVEQT